MCKARERGGERAVVGTVEQGRVLARIIRCGTDGVCID